MQHVILIIGLLMTLNFCRSAVTSDGNAGSSPTVEKHIDAFYNDSTRDVAKIQTVLDKTKQIKNLNDRIIAITQEFTGIPYVGGTLNIPTREQLYVNTSGFDCLTFVETVIAIAKASDDNNPDIDDFLSYLQSIRYRDGHINGYPSRLHYISEWAIDNGLRGNLKEISEDCGLAVKKTKTIDFMTRNRHLYQALSSDSIYQAIKNNEKPLENLEYYIIPASEVEKAAVNFLQSGDIVAIVTNKQGLDVSHVGVLNIKNGIPYLIHASSKYKKVINDTLPLKDYLNRQKSPGIRVFRISPK